MKRALMLGLGGAVLAVGAAATIAARRWAGTDDPCKDDRDAELDGKPFKACSSPKGYKNLSKGKHKFQVRATAGGQTDPTPAKDQFKAKPRN